MKRIDTINSRENMFGVGKNGFHDNADLPGQDATYVSPEWFNTVQEELCNLLELRGITLNPASKRQLYDLLTTQVDLEALADEIEANFLRKNQIIDNLTTNDADKVASARTVKELQDKKLEASDLTDASTIQKGIVQIATDQEVQASLDTSKVITPSHLGLIWAGVGKNGVDVSASRAINTIYKNTGPRSKFIAIGKSNQQAAMQLNVNDIQWGYATGSNEDSQFKTLYAIVPPQAEYGTVGSSGFRFWSEIEL